MSSQADQAEDMFDDDSSAIRIELTELLTKRLRNELSATDLGRLDAMVTADDMACQLYVQLGFETAVLLRYANRWRCMGPGHVSHLLNNENDTLPQSELLGTVAATTLVGVNESPAADRAREELSATQNVTSLLLRQSRSVFSRPVLRYAALVALCLYGSFALIAWNLRPNKLSSFAGNGSDSVATVRDTTDVQWSKDAPSKLAKSSILPHESLKIDSGTIELELRGGAQLVVEGPAKWNIEGENRVRLRSGKLYAHVPRKAIGFTVVTSSAEIVDFGTEFGVAAEASGATHVEVFGGEVAVKPRRTDRNEVQPQKMRAGDVRHISAEGTISTTTAQKKGFVAFGGKVVTQKSLAAQSGKFDPAEWTIKTPTQVKNARAFVEPKMVRLENRGYVISRNQYIPSSERPLIITGKFYAASHRDWLAIWTRSSGEPTAPFGEAADGVKCIVGLQSDELVDILAGGDKLKARQVSKEGKLKATAGMLLEFSVVDRGDQATLTVWQVSNPANRATTTAQITDQGTEYHHVVLYNCEQEGKNSNLLYLVDLQVEQSASAPELKSTDTRPN